MAAMKDIASLAEGSTATVSRVVMLSLQPKSGASVQLKRSL